MRFVELSPRAEAARTEAPLSVRRQISAAIRRIAERPAWGSSPSRFLAPNGANSGLIADLSVRGWAIIYRVKTAENTVWIEDIERHEALTNRAVMKGHRRQPVAAGW